MNSDRRSRAVAQATAMALLVASSSALADPPAATSAEASSAPTFPHVVVVTPTDEERARWSQDAAPAEGMRAYRDPETGRLREPTLDDFRREAAAAAKAAREAPAAASATAVAPQMLYRPDGTVAMRVPASTMVYAVARRAEDGSLVSDCVAGPEEASKLMQSDAPVARGTNGGHADER